MQPGGLYNYELHITLIHVAVSVLFACPKEVLGTDRDTAISQWPLKKVPRRPLSYQQYTTVAKRMLPCGCFSFVIEPELSGQN